MAKQQIPTQHQMQQGKAAATDLDILGEYTGQECLIQRARDSSLYRAFVARCGYRLMNLTNVFSIPDETIESLQSKLGEHDETKRNVALRDIQDSRYQRVSTTIPISAIEGIVLVKDLIEFAQKIKQAEGERK